MKRRRAKPGSAPSSIGSRSTKASYAFTAGKKFWNKLLRPAVPCRQGFAHLFRSGAPYGTQRIVIFQWLKPESGTIWPYEVAGDFSQVSHHFSRKPSGAPVICRDITAVGAG